MKKVRTLLGLLLHFRSRVSLALLFLLFVITGILEAVAIGTIGPFFMLLIGEGDVPDYFKFVFSEQATHVEEITQLGLLSCVAIVCANVFRMLNVLFTNHYSWGFQKHISERLLKAFVVKPHLDFVRADIGEMKRAVLNDSVHIGSGMLQSLLTLTGNTVIIILIIAFLLVNNVLATLLLIVTVFSLFGGISIVTRSFLNKIGRKKIKADAERIALVDLLLQNVKQIKAIKKLTAILDRYEEEASGYARYNAYQQILKMFPKLLFEAIFFPVVIALSLHQFSNSAASSSGLLEFYALFAFAALRLFPLVSVVFQSVSQIIFNVTALDGINAFLDGDARDRKIESEDFSGDIAQIHMSDVTFWYPGASRPVVSSFSRTFERGKWYRVVGDSGRGKTTLIDLASGIISPSTGQVKFIVGDRDIEPNEEILVGYASQRPAIINDTVLFNITLQKDPKNVNWKKLHEVLEASACQFLNADELESYVGIGGAKFSGGQIQRLCLARVLYLDPPIYVFDEITSNLDFETAKTLMRNLQIFIKDKIVIFVSHNDQALPDNFVTIGLEGL